MGWFDFFSPKEDEFFLIQDPWVEIDITIMAPYSELIRLKTLLTPYAEELGWEIESGRYKETQDDSQIGGRKITRVNITLTPEGGFISPSEFHNNKDKITGLVFSLHRDIFWEGDHQNAIKDFKHMLNVSYTRTNDEKLKREDFMIKESVSVLTYSYKLINRVNLEKQNKKFAIELFGQTTEADMKSIFEEKKETSNSEKAKKTERQRKFETGLQKSHEEMRDELERLFGFKFN